MVLLAHSASVPGREAQSYAGHVGAVPGRAVRHAQAMLEYATAPPPGLKEAIRAAATFHDLGKVDEAIQHALNAGRQATLPWDHVDAGVAHLWQLGNHMAAWLARSHHAPGLPSMCREFESGKGRRLRGGRSGDATKCVAQIAHTDQNLSRYLVDHEADIGQLAVAPMKARHGLVMRLGLSCLVDADHQDSAEADGALPLPEPVPCRWEERLERLVRHVGELGRKEAGPRSAQRAAFFDACRLAHPEAAMVSCEAPVGLGKTTAVMAYMLGRAARENLRHIIVVAPYTSIISQTVRVLRNALVLDGETCAHVIAEHHHRADFAAAEDRGFASLWRAPIIVTTAVQFFETLSSNHPSRLRKLHELPGSGVIIDEAHAALPAHLWLQNWRWLSELATSWGCRFAFSSGSLVRFWENTDIVDKPMKLPELLPLGLKAEVLGTERRRIRYQQAPATDAVADLIHLAESQPGPRLIIVNTVQTAAVLADAMRKAGDDVVHLSTALCPADRDRILASVGQRLTQHDDRDWTFIATSCVEAGVDLSFRTAFRERFSTASLIQIGGRVNRHGEYDAEGGGTIFDFVIRGGNGVTTNPAAKSSSDVLRLQFRSGEVTSETMNPAELVTRALAEEIRSRPDLVKDPIGDAEQPKVRDYPTVSEKGRVIETDTRFVVVDQTLVRRLKSGDKVGFQELIKGSVQIYGNKIEKLGLQPLPGRKEIYCWPEEHHYDSEFLGYMAEILRLQQFMADGFMIVS